MRLACAIVLRRCAITKLVRPDMHIIVVMGDGDALAIGGNHFIHAARRNIGLTAVILNNHIYGMTGGQVSPSTPVGMLATTAPYGNTDPPFPITDLSIAAGAAYVARSTVYHSHELEKYIRTGLEVPGFAVIEAVSYCHTTVGRLNKLGGAVEMMRNLKETSLTRRMAEKRSPEELERWTLLKRYLARRFSPQLCDSRADERSSLRVPIRLAVGFR